MLQDATRCARHKLPLMFRKRKVEYQNTELKSPLIVIFIKKIMSYVSLDKLAKIVIEKMNFVIKIKFV